MPRYFFHVYDGLKDLDPEGVELIDHDAARMEAVRTAGAMIADLSSIWSGKPWEMEVRDEAGATVARLIFSNSP